jgi:hypothetical protein
MQKIICKKLYDTETSTEVKKRSFGTFGDPEGYEEILFVTAENNYFLYVRGGEKSKYPKEDIKRMSKATAEEWKKEN